VRASGRKANTARPLWDLRAKDPAANPVVLRGHDDWINAVAISADSRWVVTGSADKTARLWLLQVNDLVDLARTIIGRNFFADEWQLYFPGEQYRKTLSVRRRRSEWRSPRMQPTSGRDHTASGDALGQTAAAVIKTKMQTAGKVLYEKRPRARTDWRVKNSSHCPVVASTYS
jgi:hypothetical protein